MTRVPVSGVVALMVLMLAGGAAHAQGPVIVMGIDAEDLIAEAMDGLLTSDEIRPLYQTDGRLNAAGGFFMTPRGMIKIGSRTRSDAPGWRVTLRVRCVCRS